MNSRKQEFFAKYGNSAMIQKVLDSDYGMSVYRYSPASMFRNPAMTEDQLHHIIRSTEDRSTREYATESPKFNEKHIEQMLTDGGGDHYERATLAGHPKITLEQSKRMLHDPHELSHVKRQLLQLTPHKELLHDAADMHHHDLDWSATIGILRNKNLTKDVHDKLIRHGDGMVRFTAMKHPLATVADIQHYIDTEKPDDTEDDSFAVAKEMLEKKKLEVGKEAAIKELRAKGLMKEEFEPEISISKAEGDDYQKALKIEQQSKHNPWQNVNSFKKHLHTLFVAKKGDSVVGFMYVNNTLPNKDHVAKMLVDKDHQKQGIATKLLGQLTKTTSLNVRPSNKKAFSLCQTQGFQIHKTIPKHYKNGEDAIHMIKEF